MFEAMKCNYGAWVSGFAPRALGVADDMNSQAVTDFSRTLLSMRPDVALNVSMTIFQSDFRSILPQVSLDQTLSPQAYVSWVIDLCHWIINCPTSLEKLCKSVTTSVDVHIPSSNRT